MNSLTWLLKSRSRESSLDRIGGDGQQDGDSRKSRLRTAWGGSRKDDKGKGKATPRDIAHGLRETESEAVDELLGAVERDQGVAAANQIERKASMGRDGLVRFGVPGVTERRRTRGLELVLDGGDVGSALESDSERDDDRVTLTDEERRRSRSQTPDDPSTSGLTSEHDGRGGKAPDSPPAPSMTPVDLPPLPPSPRMEDRAELASDESSAPPSSLPPAPPPPTPGPIRPTPRLPLLPPFGSRPSPDRKPSASAEKRSRIVARSAPVRWTVNLYLALRRLLSIIGVKLPRTEDPVMISAPDEKAPLLEKPAPEPKPRSYFPFFRRSAPPRPPSIFETTDEKADDRRRDRSASVASNASSDGGFESDGSLISNRLGRKASWFGRVRSTDRSGVSTPTEVGKVAPGASGKKLQALLRKPKTLVLDLDETLIHSTSRLGGMGGVSSGAGGWGGGAANGLKVRVVEVVLDGRIVVYHVYKRPWVDFFLKKVRPPLSLGRSLADYGAGLVLVYGRHLHCFTARICGSGHRLARCGSRHHQRSSLPRGQLPLVCIFRRILTDGRSPVPTSEGHTLKISPSSIPISVKSASSTTVPSATG